MNNQLEERELIDYQVIEIKNKSLFTKVVKEKCSEGYILQGGVSILEDKYLQAIAKYGTKLTEEEKEKSIAWENLESKDILPLFHNDREIIEYLGHRIHHDVRRKEMCLEIDVRCLINRNLQIRENQTMVISIKHKKVYMTNKNIQAPLEIQVNEHTENKILQFFEDMGLKYNQ